MAPPIHPDSPHDPLDSAEFEQGSALEKAESPSPPSDPSFMKDMMGFLPIFVFALGMWGAVRYLEQQSKWGFTQEEASAVFLRAGALWSSPSSPATQPERAAYQTLWGCVQEKREGRTGWGKGVGQRSDPLLTVETPADIIENCERQATFWPAATTPEMRAAVKRRQSSWDQAGPLVR